MPSFKPRCLALLLCPLLACTPPASSSCTLDDPLEVCEPDDSAWYSTGTLKHGRSAHTATLLRSGKVLLVGGSEDASAEVYDPATGVWSSTGSPSHRRVDPTATLLPDGRVLVVGGFDGSSRLASAEVYDPTSGVWASTAPLTQARSHHTAALLPGGKVLVMGGYVEGTPLYWPPVTASAEIYDPATRTWSPTASLAQARARHAATPLPDGKVLVVGGHNDSTTLPFAEVYDPATRAWSPTAPMAQGRADTAAILLRSGKVLVAGGRYGFSPPIQGERNDLSPMAGAELYDPATGTWSATSPMSETRYHYTATWLLSGAVLVAGGSGEHHLPLASAEVYDPVSGTWAATDSMRERRSKHTATLLPEGKVLVAGGRNLGAPWASAEVSQRSYFVLGCAAGPSASPSWPWLLVLLVLPYRRRSPWRLPSGM